MVPTPGAPLGISWPRTPAPLPGVSKKLLGSQPAVLLSKLRASTSQCLFPSSGTSCCLESYPCALEQNKAEGRSLWSKGQGNALPRTPFLTSPQDQRIIGTHWPLPLHLVFPGPPHGASLQGAQSPPASKASRPRSITRLMAVPSLHPRMCFRWILFLLFPRLPQGKQRPGWVPGIQGPQRATSLCSDLLREAPIKASSPSREPGQQLEEGEEDTWATAPVMPESRLDTGWSQRAAPEATRGWP